MTVLSQSSDPLITSWKPCNGTGYNSIVTNVRKIRYTSSYVYINTGSIPDYTIGPWPGNPNKPSDQSLVVSFPRTVTVPGTRTKVGLGHVGLWINGVTVYNADDGQTYNNAGYWKRNGNIFIIMTIF